MEVPEPVVTITASQPMLAEGVKDVLSQTLFNESEISVNIVKDTSYTIVDTNVGTVVMVDDPNMMIRAFSDNTLMAKAVVLSTSELLTVYDAITSLQDGNYFIDPAFVREDQESVDSPLTERQTEILQLFADGIKTDDVAKQLALSTETIRTHTKRILAKLNARTRTHAVAISVANGWIQPPKP